MYYNACIIMYFITFQMILIFISINCFMKNFTDAGFKCWQIFIILVDSAVQKYVKKSVLIFDALHTSLLFKNLSFVFSQKIKETVPITHLPFCTL